MNFESGSMVLLVSCVTVLLLIGGPELTEAGFEFGAYCRKLCAWGKGGNLCKCSAVHFAGKRQGDFPAISADDVIAQQNGGGYYPDEMPELMEDGEEEKPRITLDGIRKVYHQMETKNRHQGPSKSTKLILDTLEKMLDSENVKEVSIDRS